MAQDFVLDTKKIEIPGYPDAFNASIIEWNGYILMCFRVLPDPKNTFTSTLGLVLLNREFNPIREPQLLNLRQPGSSIPPRAEDGRLIYVGDQLYLVYSDNSEPKISKGGFRMHTAKIEYNQQERFFFLREHQILSQYEGETKMLREKNWVPFEYQGNLFLAYSIHPHLIFYPVPRSEECLTVASTYGQIEWDWGPLLGGTPALAGVADKGEYIAFFHSRKDMETVHSSGRIILHYFMGAYTFSSEPPFTITRMSPEPIVGSGFYEPPYYKPYWKSIRCVFPAGILCDEENIWVSYGRQDREIWVAKLDKRRLLSSLVPVH